MQREGFRILDNGAAEGYMEPTDSLLAKAFAINASEIVIPDKMGDADATLSMVEDFLSDPVVWKWNGGLMAVVQAATSKEVNTCLDFYLEEPMITCIALPRILAKTFGPRIRGHLADYIRDRSEIPIHCLGAHSWVEEVSALGYQGIVRGIDTSLPYVLAKKKIRLYDRQINEYVSRSEVEPYFDEILTAGQRILAQRNVDEYLRMAGVL